MKKITKNRLAALACAGAATLGFIWGPVLSLPADATARPTAADKREMIQANLVCELVESEVQFEDCVIGEFVLQRQRWVKRSGYAVDYTRPVGQQVYLTKASVGIPKSTLR